MPTADGDGPGVALVAGRDDSWPLILAAREGLYLVGRSSSDRSKMPIHRFWDRPPRISDPGGVAVFPGEPAADGKARPPYVFVAGRDAEGPALAIVRTDPGYPPVRARGAFLPLGVVRRPSASSVMALEGDSLSLIGLDGHSSRVAEAPALSQASEFCSYGRLALASGHESGTTSVWFAIAVDLEAGGLIGVDADGIPAGGSPKLVSTRPASALVPLGRYLYRVAEYAGGRLALLRYRVRFEP